MKETFGSPASCHYTPDISREQFVPDHIFFYLVSGTLTAYDGRQVYSMQPGDYCFITRNHLIKYNKETPENGVFRTIHFFFDQQFLKSFSNEYGYTADTAINRNVVTKLTPDPSFHEFIASLTPYLRLTGAEYEDVLQLKRKELLLILLKTDPWLKNVLFDFSDPGKIDLEAFMNSNFRFNVSMERFSYLTGRSLTSFKRDFRKIFNTSPGRWLLEKRLEEAYFLIEKKGQRPLNVYLEVGFEDLSHFSFAFKKKYGISPNQLKKAL
jgi:AraC-like DNA-binding protein